MLAGNILRVFGQKTSVRQLPLTVLALGQFEILRLACIEVLLIGAVAVSLALCAVCIAASSKFRDKLLS